MMGAKMQQAVIKKIFINPDTKARPNTGAAGPFAARNYGKHNTHIFTC